MTHPTPESNPAFQLIDINDNNDRAGRIVEPDWLARAEEVHRQLRPDLPADYIETMKLIFADGGRMSLAVDGTQVVAVAVWRCFRDTYSGIKFYVDDLVSDEKRRSRGAGHALLEHLEKTAHAIGAINLILDSGVTRHRAHRFYFREGFSIASHNFKKPLGGAD